MKLKKFLQNIEMAVEDEVVIVMLVTLGFTAADFEQEKAMPHEVKLHFVIKDKGDYRNVGKGQGLQDKDVLSWCPTTFIYHGIEVPGIVIKLGED